MRIELNRLLLCLMASFLCLAAGPSSRPAANGNPDAEFVPGNEHKVGDVGRFQVPLTVDRVIDAKRFIGSAEWRWQGKLTIREYLLVGFDTTNLADGQKYLPRGSVQVTRTEKVGEKTLLVIEPYEAGK